MSRTNRCLENYSVPESGKPILCGHVFAQLGRGISRKNVYDWACAHNARNNFPEIDFSYFVKRKTIYNSRNLGAKYFQLFEKTCGEVMKFKAPTTSQQAPTTSQQAPTTSQQAPTTLQQAPKTYSMYTTFLRKKVLKQSKTILRLRKKIKEMAKLMKKMKYSRRVKKQKSKEPQKLWSRKLHYDCLVRGVPANNVAELLQSIVPRFQNSITDFESSSRTTIGRMLGELGFFSDLKTATAVMNAESCTIMFDATTQEGIHVNCVILTTPSSSHLISLEHLPGGTAKDYTQHICKSIDNLSETYAVSTGNNAADMKKEILPKIKCCLTDRAPVNHLTIFLLEKKWNQQLIELNCNLHPLEAISHKVRKELQICEVKYTGKEATECLAWRIIVGMNTLRYSNRCGNIRAIRKFLRDEELPMTYITRYRGNRLHVLFHLGHIYFSLFEKIKKHVNTLARQNETVRTVQNLFMEEAVKVEFHVLAIMGKMLSGPWMTNFYTNISNEANASHTIKTVKDVISNMQQVQDPMQILSAEKDFFGTRLDGKVIEEIMVPPQNPLLFREMLNACLKGTVLVLNRQYAKTFQTVENTCESVLTSVRQHTMVAESVIGEFCDKKKISPHAYVSSISNIIKAKRNNIMQFIDEMDAETFERLLNKASIFSRKQADQRKENQDTLETEIADREVKKRQKHQKLERNRIQRKLKKIQSYSIPAIMEEFPQISNYFAENIKKILSGDMVSEMIEHIWTVELVDASFHGLVMSFSDPDYMIYYTNETREDEEYLLNKYEFASDYIMHDLKF